MSDVPEEVWRRLRRLEDAVENGRLVRRETFDLTVASLRSDYSRLAGDLAAVEAGMKEEREAREDDRKGLRNLLVGAIASAVLSLVVSLIVANAVP